MPTAAGRSAATHTGRGADHPVEVDVALCKACDICVGLCPADVLTGGRDDVPDVTHPERCTACRICEIHCPEFAVSVHLPAGRTRPRAQGDPG